MKKNYGGTVLGGWYGVFWFITCLLLVHLMMGFLSRYRLVWQTMVVLAFYTVAHFFSMTPLTKLAIPWNADVSLMAITFFFLGYTFKTLLTQWLARGTSFVTSLLIIAASVGLNITDVWKFNETVYLSRVAIE